MVGFMGVFSMIGCRALKNLASLPCGLPFFFSFTKTHEAGTKFTKVKKYFFMEFEPISKNIIGCAIEVHKILGPGLLESAYEECLMYELLKLGLMVERQKPVPVVYKEIKLECGYRLDLIIENAIILELKSVDILAPVHEAQILTYMKFSKINTGLLINFNVTSLKNGIRRYVL